MRCLLLVVAFLTTILVPAKARNLILAERDIRPIFTSEPTPLPEGCFDAKYLADVTISDGTNVKPGEHFVKTWRVRNTGTCAWEGIELRLVEGENMGATTIAVPRTMPGEETEITTEMTAPNRTGSYRSVWRYSEDSQVFGMLTVVISVEDLITPKPTPVLITQTTPESTQTRSEESSNIVTPAFTKTPPSLDWELEKSFAELKQEIQFGGDVFAWMSATFCLFVPGVIVVFILIIVRRRRKSLQHSKTTSLSNLGGRDHRQEEVDGKSHTRREYAYSTHCNICGAVQSPKRLKRCSMCGEMYCYFSPWRTPRDQFDGFAQGIGCFLLVVGTAVSILGGILLVISLYPIYAVIRLIFPDPSPPPYWKSCGDSSICRNCASKRSSYSDNSEDDSSYEAEPDYYGNDDRDDDDDRDDEGSIWDGWLIKH